MGKSFRYEARKAYEKSEWGILPDDQRQLVDVPKKSLADIDRSNESNNNKIREMISSYHHDEIGIVFLNAVQGDAKIIRFSDGKVMVVDCNIDEAPENIIEYLKEAGIKKIDYLVITHQHHDHFSGLKEIADNFEVNEVWTTAYRRKKSEESEETYQKYKEEYLDGVKTLKNNGATVKTPSARNDPKVDNGEYEVKVLGPSSYVQGNNEDIHEESMAIQIRHKNNSILLTGDTTNDGLERIRSNYDIHNTTILQGSHHGSDEGANPDAIKEAHPKFTIISVGKNNPHGHPHDEAMETYRKNTQRSVYRTDKGNIGFRLKSDGEILDIQQ